MDRARRRLPAGLACLLLLLSLTGCMRFKIATTIVNDNEIHLNMDLGVTKAAAQAAGTTNMCASDSLKDLNASGLKAVPYDDGTYIGCRISGTTTLAQTQSGDDNTWTIKRDGRTYSFTMKPSGLDDDSTAGSLSAGMIDDFMVSVTFPGKVLSHSGDSIVDGHTVTWKSPNDITQTLSATGRDSGGLPWWLWLILGAALLGLMGAGVAAILVRRRSKARAQAHAAEQQWAAQQSATMWNAQQWDGQWASQAGWTPNGQPGQENQAPGTVPWGGQGTEPQYPPGAVAPTFPDAGRAQPPVSGWQGDTGWQGDAAWQPPAPQQPPLPQQPQPWQGQESMHGSQPWQEPTHGSQPWQDAHGTTGATAWQPPEHPGDQHPQFDHQPQVDQHPQSDQHPQ